MEPPLQAQLEEAKSKLRSDPSSLGEWLQAFSPRQSVRTWREFLAGLLELSSDWQEQQLEGLTPEEVTLSALEQLWLADRLDLAYLFSSSLVQAGILPASKLMERLLSLATRLESSPAQDPERRLQVCLKLRQMAFELDPTRRDNIQVLLYRALQAEDELGVGFYSQALLESLAVTSPAEGLDITKEALLTQLLTRLIDEGYIDFFFEIATAIQRQLIESQRAEFAALLAQLAAAMDPPRAAQYEGLWTIENLIGDFFQKATRALFQHSTSDGYSIVGEALLKAAESPLAQENFSLRLSLLSESIEKLIHAARAERISFAIQQIMDLLSSRFTDLESLEVNDENLSESLTIAKAILFRVCFCWSYLTDDRSLIRRYQQLGGRIFSNCLSLMAAQRDFLWSDYWKKNRHKYQSPSADGSWRKLRVGFLGSCFQRHSVGFLSEAILRNLSRNLLDITYYYYQGWESEEAAAYDDMYQKFRSQENITFRFFPEGVTAPRVAAQAREDGIDIMVFMDSITSHDANVIAALRAAPIQIGWLGGDAVGLPEFDYFFADPYVLPDDAQSDYHEKIIRLPSYCAVESLAVDPADELEFKSKLGIDPENVIFLTAASAYKRTPECIDAHLQILKEVPKAILIVKGSGEIATVISRYQEKAKELGVLDRLRFLAKTKSVEEHRGQLGLVDLVLDTFPYTGATHTAEALYMGVPVLTLVGRHYYGRMSYSLLKNVGLEDCITWSAEEFIERGIQLGNNPEQISSIKKRIRASRRWSVIWDPREQARSMETAFFDSFEGRSREIYTPYPNNFYSTPEEWNQAGIELIQSLSSHAPVSERQSTWERALFLWRRGLTKDPYHIPCWLNRIHALLVLGDRSRAFEDAYALLEFLCTEASDSYPSKEADIPIWVKKDEASPNHANAHTKCSYLFYLARWMAAHIGVVYRPEAMRFWELAYLLKPDDIESALAVAVELLSQRRVEGLALVNHILSFNPGHQRANLVKQIAVWEIQSQVKPTHSSLPAELYFDYENCKLSLEPSFSSIVTRVLLTRGEWFEGEIDFCKHFLVPGMNVIDVGANVGVYTFLASAQVGATGSVIAIEPTASCVQHLRKTVDASSTGNVEIIQAAAGEYEGTIQFCEEKASVYNSIANDRPTLSQVSEEGVKTVDLVTLDSIWRSKGKPRIDLIKIDVEGAEEKVINGALELISTTYPTIVYENQNTTSKSSGFAVARLLEPLGYSFYTYNRFLHKLTKVDPIQQPVSSLNIIAVHLSGLGRVSGMILESKM